MKKTKFLNTLIALIVLVAAWGAITWYNKRKSNEKPPAETTHEVKVFPVDSQHIESITFRPRDGEAFTCRHDNGNWSIVDPHHLDVDQGNLSGVLNSLTTATADEVVDAHPADLKQFGLDPPSFTLEVTTNAQPQSFTLKLGDDTPTSAGVYAQASGNPQVFTLASYLKTSLEKKVIDLRDRRAMTLDADQLQKIAVQYKGAAWTLAKNPEGVWDLDLPPSVRADRFTVDGLVSQLRGLNMQTIAADDKKKAGDFGFGSPELHLQLTSSGGTQTIVVGKKAADSDQHYAMNSALEPVFTLNSDFITQFKKDPADLREKDLFSYSAFEVKHVEVNTPKGHWVFERQGNGWKQTAPNAKTVNSDKMDDFLTRLRNLRADSFPKGGNAAQFGLANPLYRFTVQAGNTTETVEAGKSGDHVYARRSTDPLPSELPAAALDEIDKSLAAL